MGRVSTYLGHVCKNMFAVEILQDRIPLDWSLSLNLKNYFIPLFSLLSMFSLPIRVSINCLFKLSSLKAMTCPLRDIVRVTWSLRRDRVNRLDTTAPNHLRVMAFGRNAWEKKKKIIIQNKYDVNKSLHAFCICTNILCIV